MGQVPARPCFAGDPNSVAYVADKSIYRSMIYSQARNVIQDWVMAKLAARTGWDRTRLEGMGDEMR
jgi:hypothetical protein